MFAWTEKNEEKSERKKNATPSLNITPRIRCWLFDEGSRMDGVLKGEVVQEKQV